MSFPRYAEYRESGVDWIGALPRHWQVAPLKYVAEFRSGGTPDKGRREFWDGDVPWASAKDLKTTNLLDTIDHLTDEAINAGAASVIDPGTVLVVVRGMILARLFPVVRACVPMAINQDLKGVIARPGMHTDYLAWLLRGSERETLSRLDEAGHGTKALRMDLWTSMQLPLPPADEQVALTTFLDRETAKIDALVEEQKRLIELLKEKRQAVISQAVTKGLDPNVPMKDSGVEWLGRVPEHWEVRKVNSLSTKITNGYVGPTRDILVDDGVRYLQSLHIKGNCIKFDASYFVTEQWSNQHSKSILEIDDLLIVQTGDIGQAAVVTKEFAGCNCHALIIVSPLRGVVCGEYLGWAFNSDYGRNSLLAIQTGALHPHLNCGNVKDVFMPVPPVSEQRKIVEYCGNETAALDNLASQAEAAIVLLSERRSALISAAVTGKIDVRGLVSQWEQAAA